MSKNEKKYYNPQLVGQSEEVKTANQQMQNMAMPSNDYVKQYYQSAIDKMNQPFSYDYANDPSYKALYQVAVNNGQKAMKDTIGKATALTGGYMNSYAQTAGQGAYNDYMTRLNEQIPTLENAAYQRYRQGISDAIQQADLAKLMYGMDTDAYDREYSRLADQRDFAYKQDASNTDILNRAAEYNLGLDNQPYENDLEYDLWKKKQDYSSAQGISEYAQKRKIDENYSSSNVAQNGTSSLYNKGTTDYNRAVKVATDEASGKHYDSAGKTLGGYVGKTLSAEDAGGEYAKILIEAVNKGDMTSEQASKKFEEWTEKYGGDADTETLWGIRYDMEKEIGANANRAKNEQLLEPWKNNSNDDVKAVQSYYYMLHNMGEYNGSWNEFWDALKSGKISLTRGGKLIRN